MSVKIVQFEKADANFQKHASPVIKDEVKESVLLANKDVPLKPQ